MTREVPQPRPTGRPPLTSPAKLLSAAWEIGLDGLTIGRVTAAAGVKYSTFYRHFRSREALISAMVDDAVLRVCGAVEGEAPAVDAGDEMVRAARLLGGELDARPGLAAALVAQPWPPVPLASIRDVLGRRLQYGGVSTSSSGVVAELLISSVVFTHLVTAHAPLDTPGWSGPQDFLQLITHTTRCRG
jgi:AcrR family transcriptional regulator